MEMSSGSWTDLVSAAVVPSASTVAFAVLAALRWFGLLLAMPSSQSGSVPLRLRFVLAVVLAVAVLPVGRTSPQPFPVAAPLFTCVIHGALSGLSELALGAVLGFGIRIVLSGLRLAGALIDPQAGLAVGQVFDPAAGGHNTLTGRVFVWLAVIVFFGSPAWRGDLLLVARMLDLFKAIPPGAPALEGFGSPGLIVVFQQSLALALFLAAPVLAAMSLMTLATGWLGRSEPRLGLGPLVVPIRITVSLAVLSTGLPAHAVWLADRFQNLLERAPALFSTAAG